MQVAGRLRSVVRVSGSGTQRVTAGIGTPAAAGSAAAALTGTEPILVSPILASATVPFERRASAATPTVAHDCAVRWNFSYR